MFFQIRCQTNSSPKPWFEFFTKLDEDVTWRNNTTAGGDGTIIDEIVAYINI